MRASCDEIRALYREGVAVAEIRQRLRVGTNTIYGALHAEDRRRWPGPLTSVVGRADRVRYSAAERDALAQALRVDRDPCIRCGVRADDHAAHGCAQGLWR